MSNSLRCSHKLYHFDSKSVAIYILFWPSFKRLHHEPALMNWNITNRVLLPVLFPHPPRKKALFRQLFPPTPFSCCAFQQNLPCLWLPWVSSFARMLCLAGLFFHILLLFSFSFPSIHDRIVSLLERVRVSVSLDVCVCVCVCISVCQKPAQGPICIQIS